MDWFTLTETLIWLAPLLSVFISIGTLIFFILNFIWLGKQLRVMQKQFKFGNRGFLIISAKKIEESSDTPNSNVNSLRLYYTYLKTSRIPLLLRKIDWKSSLEEKINVRDWYDGLCKEEISSWKGPIIPGEEHSSSFPACSGLKCFIQSDLMDKKYCFYIHCIISFEDSLGEVHWVYMRWKIEVLVDQKKPRRK